MNRITSAKLAAVLGLILTIAAVPNRSVQSSETFTVGTLHVERFGNPSGRPVIMVPGLFCGTWEFNGQIAALAPTSDIYAVTLPGMDGIPRDTRGNLMQRTMKSIDALIRVRKLQKPVLVGHSLGGTIVVDFGETYPDDAGQIISLEGGMPVANSPAAAIAYADSEAKRYRGDDAKTFDNVLRTTLIQYTVTSKVDQRKVAPLMEKTDPNAAADWFRAALGLYLTPGLSKMRAQFTYIAPFDQSIDSYTGSKTLAEKRAKAIAFASAAHGSVIMIAPARHFLMWDQPAAVNAALVKLIAG